MDYCPLEYRKKQKKRDPYDGIWIPLIIGAGFLGAYLVRCYWRRWKRQSEAYLRSCQASEL